MSRAVRALRGATTIDEDTVEAMYPRVTELLKEMWARNDVDHDDIISIIFTVTDDITCAFPAAAARTIGLGDVPLLCSREIPVPGAMPLCVRVLAHVHTDKSRPELHHVYLEQAKSLRDDLPA